MRRTGRRASPSCGGAGTFRCPACCATTSTFRWVAIAGASGARTSIWPIVMLLGGLWHGAKWNFVVWGAYHGGSAGLRAMARQDQPVQPLAARYARGRDVPADAVLVGALPCR